MRQEKGDLVAQKLLRYKRQQKTLANYHRPLGGGAWNQEKCSAYFLCWRFIDSMPQLKHLDELPQPISEVQQKDGSVNPAHLKIAQPIVACSFGFSRRFRLIPKY